MSAARKHCLFWLGFGLLLLYHLWLAAQIPYGVDDWSWGGSLGAARMLSGELNSRYAGNLTEILLARSPVLKTLVMGLSFTLIPAAALAVVTELWELPKPEQAHTALLLLGAVLMLTVPRTVWAQGYSWVAGFSNFTFSGLLLCCYHRLLLRDELRQPAARRPLYRFAGLALSGFVMELYIENLSLYVFGLTGLLLLVRLARKRPTGRLLPLFLGCAAGLVLMFSNALFRTLLREGEALDGYRSLTFSMSDGPVKIALILLRRFLGDISWKLWGGNWVMCSLIVLLLLLLAARRGRWGLVLLDALYLVYFPASQVYGSIPLPAFSPIHYLSGLAEPLFFLLVLAQLLFFWRGERRVWLPLAASWLSVPALIVPMLAINPVGPRSYLTTDILLMQFCLLLAARVWIEAGGRGRGLSLALCALALSAVCVQRAVVYAQIGAVNREREAAVREAIATGAEEIWFRAFPYPEYLWITDNEYGNYGDDIRDYYGIPRNTALCYESTLTH